MPDRPLEPADLSDSYGENNSMISEAATTPDRAIDPLSVDGRCHQFRSLEKFVRPGGAGRALHLILHFL